MIMFDRYARRSFDVIAVKITAENFEEVAEWCGSTINTIDRVKGKPDTRYIKVEVERPQYKQNVRAYNGDWIVRGSATSFKVYRDQQFRSTFRLTGVDNHSAVFEIIREAMSKQDAATYHGEIFQSEACEEATDAILKVFDGTAVHPVSMVPKRSDLEASFQKLEMDREKYDKIVRVLRKNGAGVHMGVEEIAIQIMGV
jgi:hypothetical protein